MNPTTGTMLDPNAWGPACPPQTFLNSQTGQCETFTVGAPVPSLPSQLGLAWWQLGLVFVLGGTAGALAFKFLRKP